MYSVEFRVVHFNFKRNAFLGNSVALRGNSVTFRERLCRARAVRFRPLRSRENGSQCSTSRILAGYVIVDQNNHFRFRDVSNKLTLGQDDV